MEVIVKEAIDVAEPTESANNVSKLTHERASVDIVPDDRDLASPTDGHVIHAVGKQSSRSSRHSPARVDVTRRAANSIPRVATESMHSRPRHDSSKGAVP
jgi:hypothetical protein